MKPGRRRKWLQPFAPAHGWFENPLVAHFRKAFLNSTWQSGVRSTAVKLRLRRVRCRHADADVTQDSRFFSTLNPVAGCESDLRRRIGFRWFPTLWRAWLRS